MWIESRLMFKQLHRLSHDDKEILHADNPRGSHVAHLCVTIGMN
jgi:hypothetical protein